MLETALKAGITFMSVTTDDPVNFESVLASFTKPMKVTEYGSSVRSLGLTVYWTDGEQFATSALYSKFKDTEHQMVFVNVQPSALVMDCGVLQVPTSMVLRLLTDSCGPEGHVLLPLLKGLSLKAVEDVLRLTQARAGNTLPPEVRRTRMELGGTIQGLYPTDTSFDFYEAPTRLKHWLTLNKPYLFAPNVHPKLLPRGLLLEGSPGVGKSMAAKFISRELSVPLYRLDIATTLDKYIGVSEQRVAKILNLVDREEPCVLLIDEVEKIFGGKDETGVTQRIMSQLLWWLAEHRSRVVTIMTTNNKSLLPPEMYREGRIDDTMVIHRLSGHEATSFAHRVWLSVTKTPYKFKHPAKDHLGGPDNASSLSDPLLFLTKHGEFSHAEVAERVYTEIKKTGWVG